MKQHTITDKPTILRLLVEQGCTEKVRSLDPDNPGATGIFPDILDARKWFIVTFVDGIYTATALEDCDQGQAVAFAIAHVTSISESIGGAHIADLPAPTPKHN